MTLKIIATLLVIGLILASFASGLHEGQKNQLAIDAIIANGEFPEPRPVFETA